MGSREILFFSSQKKEKKSFTSWRKNKLGSFRLWLSFFFGFVLLFTSISLSFCRAAHFSRGSSSSSPVNKFKSLHRQHYLYLFRDICCNCRRSVVWIHWLFHRLLSAEVVVFFFFSSPFTTCLLFSYCLISEIELLFSKEAHLKNLFFLWCSCTKKRSSESLEFADEELSF